ncbi:hypothetical protein, partial [Streptomyces sp. 4F14]|uniref:hypothetical protein n=1 Tax=Streptomyces sp. 4F14 TaxID=3394380 RepID=UPI003A895906
HHPPEKTRRKGGREPMDIETDALQLLLAEESSLYVDGGLNPDKCGVTCPFTCEISCELSKVI